MVCNPYTADTDQDGRHIVRDLEGRAVLVVSTAGAAVDLANAMSIGAYETEAKALAAIREMGS